LEKLAADRVIGYRWIDWKQILNAFLGLVLLWLVILIIKAKRK
jgi:hypothetical protein